MVLVVDVLLVDVVLVVGGPAVLDVVELVVAVVELLELVDVEYVEDVVGIDVELVVVDVVDVDDVEELVVAPTAVEVVVLKTTVPDSVTSGGFSLPQIAGVRGITTLLSTYCAT